MGSTQCFWPEGAGSYGAQAVINQQKTLEFYHIHPAYGNEQSRFFA
jgi:hypothetical protein